MLPMTYDEYLAHHGIIGMRWGKRNGPPYPLNESQMTPKERAKNEVSEFAANVRLTKRKEREQVRRAKFKEREARRQNMANEKEQARQARVQEKEQTRQNKVDEKEQVRQNKVDEKEWTRQNIVDREEQHRQYLQGKKYVTKFLIGAGITAAVGYKIYKGIKNKNLEKANMAEVSKLKELASLNDSINRGQKAAEDYILKNGILKLNKIKG